MRPSAFAAALAAFLLPAAVFAAPVPRAGPLRLSPMQAVMNAAEMPSGVSGVFEMVVRASGRDRGFLYLNSETDYRDPRNLTIVVAAAQERDLAARLGGPVEPALRGRTIAVRGTARKTRIDFTADGHATGKYYFQTHLRLGSARDLTVAGERPAF